jgi:hypothetical protein
MEAKKAHLRNACRRFFVKTFERVAPVFNIEYWNLAMLWFGSIGAMTSYR